VVLRRLEGWLCGLIVSGSVEPTKPYGGIGGIGVVPVDAPVVCLRPRAGDIEGCVGGVGVVPIIATVVCLRPWTGSIERCVGGVGRDLEGSVGGGCVD
jgi:hypothetical protein